MGWQSVEVRSGYLVLGSVVDYHFSIWMFRTSIRVLSSMVDHYVQQEVELWDPGSEVIVEAYEFDSSSIYEMEYILSSKINLTQDDAFGVLDSKFQDHGIYVVVQDLHYSVGQYT